MGGRVVGGGGVRLCWLVYCYKGMQGKSGVEQWGENKEGVTLGEWTGCGLGSVCFSVCWTCSTFINQNSFISGFWTVLTLTNNNDVHAGLTQLPPVVRVVHFLVPQTVFPWKRAPAELCNDVHVGLELSLLFSLCMSLFCFFTKKFKILKKY